MVVNHDADMPEKLEDVTDKSESILGLRKSTVRGNCSHLRAHVASFMEAAMAAKLVVVGGVLVSVMAVLLRGTIIRPQFRLYVDASHWFASIKLFAVFQLSVSPATSQMPFFERIMDAIILVELLIPLIRPLYLLLPPLFLYFFPSKEVIQDEEIKILSQLEHPNTVKCYGNEIVGRYLSLYIQPGSLKKYILELGVLHGPSIRNFTEQILSWLDCQCNKRVVDRDIEPDNLLVYSNDIVKLINFGLAKHVLQKIEYKRSLEASAADIWSLGCVIIKMFSGKHPRPGFAPVQAFYKVCVEQQHPPIPEGLCEEGKGFLELCFTRTPADRPSAAALLDHSFISSWITRDVCSRFNVLVSGDEETKLVRKQIAILS
ncbi:mitogen-activated protein kinase kinase kinase 5-like [Neltuma alba]|uniref:mitogen-activated protein kinase kinase kinase 5-like n=1 Tax=Neltuma alba TaxID=207710 RepID=UPI0010A543CE|nr:mitogen-activated protein kinase kinase kinase 5-like [Prosopis alba]